MKRLWLVAAALAVMTAATVRTAFALEETVASFDTTASTFSFSGGADAWADNNFDTLTYLGPTGSSFHLQWGAVNASDEYAGGGVRLAVGETSTINISTYSFISFLIYTPNANMKAEVKLSDYVGGEEHAGKVKLSEYVTTKANTWQQVIIPIAAFLRTNPTLDLTKANNIIITADYTNGVEYDAAGNVFIEDVKLSNQHHAPAYTVLYSGSDAGVTSLADTAGDTLLCWDQAVSSITSNLTQVHVSTGYAVAWAKAVPTDANTLAGTTYYFSYAVRNDGNAGDRVVFSTATTAGQAWPVTVFWDKDKSSSFTAGDAAWADTMGLLPDSTHYLLVGVYIPNSATNGQTSTVSLTAKDNSGSGANDNWPTTTNDDTITDSVMLTCAIPTISVVKSTDVAYVLPGSTVTYTMTVSNSGSSSATNLMLTDVLPLNMVMSNVTTGTTGAPTIEYYVGSSWTTTYNVTATRIRYRWATLANGANVVAVYKARAK